MGKDYWGWTAYQEGLVELKQTGELFEQLVHTVQPLQKHGTLLADVVRVLLVAAAVPELMAVVQPIGLHQHLETLERERDTEAWYQRVVGLPLVVPVLPSFKSSQSEGHFLDLKRKAKSHTCSVCANIQQCLPGPWTPPSTFNLLFKSNYLCASVVNCGA